MIPIIFNHANTGQSMLINACHIVHAIESKEDKLLTVITKTSTLKVQGSILELKKKIYEATQK